MSKRMFFKNFVSVVNLNTDLVAYFKLDSNSNDYVNGNDGTDVGSVSYVTGKINNACRYVASSYNSIPHSSNYDFSSAGQDIAYSFNMWLAMDSTAATSFLITKRSGSVSPIIIQAIVSSGTIKFLIYNGQYSAGASISATSETVSFTSGVYFMLTITYDGSENANGFKFYLNGSIMSATPSSSGTYTSMQLTTGALLIGNEIGNPASRYTRGNIDELAIWKNRELSATDVTELYNSGSGKPYPF